MLRTSTPFDIFKKFHQMSCPETFGFLNGQRSHVTAEIHCFYHYKIAGIIHENYFDDQFKHIPPPANDDDY